MKKLLWLAILGLCGCRLQIEDATESITGMIDDARNHARVGIVANLEIGPNTRLLAKALSYFRYHKADAVVLLGKLTHDDYLTQYRLLNSTCEKILGESGIRWLAMPGPSETLDGHRFANRILGEHVITNGAEVTVNDFRFLVAYNRFGIANPLRLPLFYAYGKLPLTDERCFYPRTNLALAAGSLSGIIPVFGGKPNQAEDGAGQGLFVHVYSDIVRIERLDFATAEPKEKRLATKMRNRQIPYAEPVAEPWILHLEDGKWMPEPAPATPPRFWDDTKLICARGIDADGIPVYTVKFPLVQKRHTGERAFTYRIEALDPQGKVIARKEIPSTRYFLSEIRDTEHLEASFTARELDGCDRPKFRVTPITSLGIAGPAVY